MILAKRRKGDLSQKEEGWYLSKGGRVVLAKRRKGDLSQKEEG